MNALIWANNYISPIRLPFFKTQTEPIHQLTQDLCYNLPFHLYIHDQGLQQTFATLTCVLNMYEPPYMSKKLYFTYLVTFFWLKRIPIHQLTQNLCFNFPFHLYIHDQGLQQTFATLVGWTCMNPLIWANNYISPIRLPFFSSNGY